MERTGNSDCPLEEKTTQIRACGWFVLSALLFVGLLLSTSLTLARPAHQKGTPTPTAFPSRIPPSPLSSLPLDITGFLVENQLWVGGGCLLLLLLILGTALLLPVLRGARQRERPGPSHPPPSRGLMDPSLKTVGPSGEPRHADLSPESAALEVHPHLEGVVLKTGQRTDVGLERAFNEDSFISQVFAPSPHSVGVPVGLFAVADGMGGHAAGDVASRLAVETIAQRAAGETLAAFSATSPAPDAGLWLSGAVQAANRAIHMQRGDTGANMGATLVAALVVGDTAAVANVGDSRAYLLGEHGITQITTDHSLVERLVAAGQITREEAAVHPQRHVIYRTLGELPQVEVDLFEQHLASGEALLLCSDGLSGMVPDEQIWQIWHTSPSPQEACDRLTEAANQAGGKDNIAVVIVQVGG